MDLPDEIMLQILGSVDSKALLSTRLVNHRLCGITRDPRLIKLNPHYIINDHPYLNEEVYTRRELLLEVFKAGTVDLSWLVKNTTAAIRSSGLTPAGWLLVQNAAWNVTQSAAWGATAYSTVMNMERSTWLATSNHLWSVTRYVTRSPSWFTWNSAQGAVLDTVAESVTKEDVKGYLHGLELRKPIEIGKHAYLIAECLMICKIDKDLCLRVQGIVTQYGLEDITFQLAADIAPNNPWARQFYELY